MQMHEIIHSGHMGNTIKTIFYCEGNGEAREGLAWWVSIERGESLTIPIDRIWSIHSTIIEDK